MASCMPLKFPSQDGNVILVDQLPDDVQELLQILESEAVPLQQWWDLARAYLAQGRTAQYLTVLQSALDPEFLNSVEEFFKRRPTFEIVQFNCGCAAHHIEAARLEQDKAARTQHLADAAARVNAAKQEGPNEMLPYLASGCLALARGDANMAMLEFKNAERRLHNDRPNLAPLLGQAAVHFNAGRLAEALALYKRALARHPGAPAEVRLGLAACFFRGGHMDLAQAAYERVLELEPSNADALLGLATLHLNSRELQQGTASGMELLGRAFRADPGHPGVLAALAHFLMLQGHHQRALQLADASLLAADTEPLRAFATALRARAAHALGQLAEAERGYRAASRIDPKAPLPRLGAAQAALGRGEYVNAASELELALQHAPANVDALRLLGALSSELPDRVGRSKQHFLDASAKHPDDADLKETLGELLSGTDPKASLEAYESALALHRARQAAAVAAAAADGAAVANGAGAGGAEGAAAAGASVAPYRVPARLLNNLAVLRYRASKVAGARELLEEAVADTVAGGDVTTLQKITLGYNMARLKEASGDLQAAAAEYERLIENFPSYVDCYLRLASIARAGGNTDSALEWARRATQAGGDGADANALLATLLMEQGDNDAARKLLEKVLAKAPAEPGKPANGAAAAHANDPYCKLALASLWLRTAPAAAKKPEDRAKARAHLDKAQKLYTSVLQKEPRNAYAANGLGVCLAESGHLDAAREAFAAVQEAAAASSGFMRVTDADINLAHVALGKQAYEQALAYYERASADHRRKNSQVLLYTARALYDKDDLVGARAALEAAIHVAPADAKLRFDLALCLQEWAVRIFQRKRPEGDPTKVAEFEDATERLLQAHAIFAALQARGREATRIDNKKLQAHVDFCTRTHAAALRHLERAQHEAAVLEAKRVKYEQERRAEAAAREEAELRAKAEKEAEEAALQRRLREQNEALNLKLQGWQEKKLAAASGADDVGEKGGKGKKRRRKGKGGEGEGFIADEDDGGGRASDDDEDEQGALRRAGLASGSEGEAGGASDADDLFGSGDEDGGGSGGEGAAAKGKKEKRRKKEKRKDKEGKRDRDRGGSKEPRGDKEKEKEKGGRLKRRAAAAAAAGGDGEGGDGGGGGGGSGAVAEEEEMEDLFGEDIFADPVEDEGAGGGGGGGDGGGEGSARKRPRHGAAISDSEGEEDGGGGGGGAGGDAPGTAAGGEGDGGGDDPFDDE